MAASPHTHSTTPPRGTEYCVDCYAVNGRVTVATRMFKDDALCERHYLVLCKELEIEPEALPAAASTQPSIKQFSAQAEKKVSGSAPARRSTSGRPPLVADDPSSVCAAGTERQHSGSADSPDFSTDVTAALGAQGYKLRDAERAVKQSYQPGDTFNAAFKKAFDVLALSRQIGRPVAIATSQRPDSSVAPAAEGLRDRAHSPTRPAPSQGSGVPQTPSAANPQPQPRKEITMPRSETALRNDKGERVCSCGCGAVLGSRHPYIKGHNTATFKAARKAHDEARGAQPPSAAKTNGHSAPLPPVAITNGNGHGKIASDGAYLVPCQVSEWAMDRIWLRLTPEEKAELLFRPPEAPQKEQQEPSHA